MPATAFELCRAEPVHQHYTNPVGRWNRQLVGKSRNIEGRRRAGQYLRNRSFPICRGSRQLLINRRTHRLLPLVVTAGSPSTEVR